MGEEDEEDAEGEDEKGGVAGGFFLVGEFGPFVGEAGGEIFFGVAGHDIEGLSGADAGGAGAVDFGGGVEVVAVDAVGVGDVFKIHDGAEGDHLALGVAGFELSDVGGVGAEGGVGLGDDAEGAAEVIEVVDVETAEVDLQSLENVGDGDFFLFGFGAIDVGVELGDVGAEGAVERGEARIGAGGGDERAGDGLEFLRGGASGAIFDLHFETDVQSDAADGGRREHEGEAFLHLAEGSHEVSGEGVGGLSGFSGAFVEAVEREEHDAGVGLVGAGEEVEAGDGEGVVDAGGFGGDLRELGEDVIGAVDGGGVGEGDGGDEITLILLGDEAEGDGFKEVIGGGDEAGVDEEHDEGEADDVFQDADVGDVDTAEGMVEEVEEPSEEEVEDGVEPVFFGGVGFEDECGEGGAEGEGVEGGEEGGEGDGEGELAIELAGDAGDEGDGDEHRREPEGDGDDGGGDFFHRLDGGVVRGEAALDPAVDVFDDDDGVIDDDADGEDETEEGEHVEGEAEHPHDGEGADEGDGDGQERDEGSAPALEEDEDDEGDEGDGFKEGFDDVLDAVADEGGGVVGDGIGDAGGEALFEVFHFGVDGVGGGDGVGAGELEDGQSDGGESVEVGGGGIIGGGEFDAGDVLEAGDAAVGAGFDDDVGELFGIDESALSVDGVLELGGAFGKGEAADDAGGDLHVLVADGVDEITGGDIARSEFFRIEPESHGVIAGAEDEDIADAGEAGDFILDLKGGEVAEVERIAGAVGGIDGDGECDIGGGFFDDDAAADDFRGEDGLGDGDAVLDLDLGDVEVGAELEGDGELHAAVIAALAGHVEHAFDAVDLFFDGGGNGFGDGFGVGAGIVGADGDGGGRDFRILRDGEGEDGDGANDDGDDGEHAGEDRALNEEVSESHRLFPVVVSREGRVEGDTSEGDSEEGCEDMARGEMVLGLVKPASLILRGASVGATTAPGRTCICPLIMTRASGERPEVMERHSPKRAPSWTMRGSTLLSLLTMRTLRWSWSFPMAVSGMRRAVYCSLLGIRRRAK